MGLFGKKKSKEAAGADYVDVETANEALPIAVLAQMRLKGHSHTMQSGGLH